jgi:hypothetical protein
MWRYNDNRGRKEVFSSRETAWKDDKKLTYINLTKKI